MMDLIFEYLIVFILLFCTNIAFLVRKSDFNKNKFIILAVTYAAIVFVLSFILPYLNLSEYLIPFMPCILGFVSLLILILAIRHVSLGRNFNIDNDKAVFYGTVLSSSVMFLVYKISKIFNKAKRPYYAVIGEYMFLEFIFSLILALTFSTVRELDYSIFKSFLILTPTYQLMYMIIAIIMIVVLGVLYGDWILKRLKRK